MPREALGRDGVIAVEGSRGHVDEEARSVMGVGTEVGRRPVVGPQSAAQQRVPDALDACSQLMILSSG